MRVDLDRFGARQGREDAGQPPHEHGLAGAGGPGQQQVMPAGRGDLGGASRDELASQVEEVRPGRLPGSRPGGLGKRRDRPGAEHVLDGRRQVRNGDDVDAFDRAGFERAGGRKHDLLEAGVARRERQAEGAAHPSHLAAEAEFADEHAASRAGRTGAAEPEEAERHREIESGAALSKIGRRQVDRDGARRDREAGVAQRGPHAIARLAHAGVGKPDDGEAGEPVGGIDLDVEHAGLEPQGGGGVDAGEHESSSGPRRPDRG